MLFEEDIPEGVSVCVGAGAASSSIAGASAAPESARCVDVGCALNAWDTMSDVTFGAGGFAAAAGWGLAEFVALTGAAGLAGTLALAFAFALTFAGWMEFAAGGRCAGGADCVAVAAARAGAGLLLAEWPRK